MTAVEHVRHVRKTAADFLQTHLDVVTKIENDKPGSVEMSAYVTQFDNECGTVCCMEGWLPYTFPDKFKWKGWPVVLIHGLDIKNIFITPIQEISTELWDDLTGTGDCTQFPPSLKIGLRATFKEVKRFWQYTIDSIREGKLDHMLNFSAEYDGETVSDTSED